MKRTIALLAGAGAAWAACLALTPSVSSAAATTAATQLTYNTSMVQTEPLPSAGVIAGKLSLSVSNDGLVSGWYVPLDAGSPVIVTGSERGDQLSLEIGDMGTLRVDGTLAKDGRIVGTATEFPFAGMTTLNGIPPSFNFVATPAG